MKNIPTTKAGSSDSILILLLFTAVLSVAVCCEDIYAQQTLMTSPSAHPISGVEDISNHAFFKDKRIVLLPLDFRVFYLSVAEPPKEMQDWSELAKANFTHSLQTNLLKRNFKNLEILSEDVLKEHLQENLRETRALFDVVHQSIQLHVHGHSAEKSSFEGKKVSDYTLGKDIANLSSLTDIFVLIKGFDEVHSPGKQAGSIAMAALGGAAFGLAGGIAVGSQVGESTAAVVAFVDGQSGTFIWEYYLEWIDTVDLREQKDANMFVDRLLRDLPF